LTGKDRKVEVSLALKEDLKKMGSLKDFFRSMRKDEAPKRLN